MLANTSTSGFQEPSTTKTTSCTEALSSDPTSDLAENKTICFQTNVLTGSVIITLVGLITYIYYRHIQHYNKIISHQSSPQDNSGTLSSTAPAITEHPRLQAEFSLSQLPQHHGALATIPEQQLPPLHVSTSETQLRTVLSQPSLASTETPIAHLLRTRRLSGTPPTYAHPLAVHLPELGSPSSSTNNLQTYTTTYSSGFLSPTSSMTHSQTYRELLKKLDAAAQDNIPQ